MKVNNKFKKGFTLVELVVVIAVIAILAAVSVGAYFGVTDSANDSKLTSESANIKLNITLLGSEGNSYCNINKDYLEINDVTLFNEELTKDTGIRYNVLINGTGNIDNSNDPIINFIGINNSDTKFDYFEYSTVEIVNKYIKVNLISGDSEIIKGNIEINDSDTPTEEPDIALDDEVIDNYEGSGSIVIELGDDSSVGLADNNGQLISSATYSCVSNSDEKYNITLRDMNNIYEGAGKSNIGAIKVGHNDINLKTPGEFKFDVADDVVGVIFYIGDKKQNGCMVEINGVTSDMISSNNIDHKIMATTRNNKTVSFKTIGSEDILYQVAYINKIELILA